MKNIKVGNQFKLTKTRYWGGGNKQVVTSIIKITKTFDTSCDYKTIEILEATNVNPIVGNLLDIKGGFSFAMFDLDLPSFVLEEV
jgi:hypothetical protein